MKYLYYLFDFFFLLNINDDCDNKINDVDNDDDGRLFWFYVGKNVFLI